MKISVINISKFKPQWTRSVDNIGIQYSEYKNFGNYDIIIVKYV
ncbi:MAG: hypothetical protein QG659_568 [Patescibacteria group bacterium]|jgi:hypothetical protein|nr:hypothetical protein [Patescibacteria group bacterium]